MLSRRSRFVEGLVVLAAATVFTLITLPAGALGGSATADDVGGPTVLPLDDAYIFVRFAQQLSRGNGLEWTDGIPSSGATSLAYVVLLLPGQWVGDGLADWGRWSQWVGLMTLWLLGLAALSLLRALRLPRPWPLLGALAVTLSGPIGWAALAGMESALNAAAILFACGCAVRLFAWSEGAVESVRRAQFVVAFGVLPLFRPENFALSVLAFVALLVLPAGRPGRAWAPLTLVPGVLLMLLNLWMTGTARPAGATAKAITEFPFLDPLMLWDLYSRNLGTRLFPAYLGSFGNILPPPVGWIVLGAGVVVPVLAVSPKLRADSSLRGLAVPVVAWWVLFLLAPVSSMLNWQYMRHHHAGIALSWVIAVSVVAFGLEHLIGRFALPVSLRWAGALPPILLLLGAPAWGEAFMQGQQEFVRRHGAAGEWLTRQTSKQLLLLNDAGYLQVCHDGPAIDILGLGTPAFGPASRHGPGAWAEALARQPQLPTIAAVNRGVFLLADLLGEPILPPPEVVDDTLLAEVRTDLLRGTALSGRGIDFTLLEDEQRASVGWTIEPTALEPSAAVLWREGEVGASLQGCRPVPERIWWDSPADVTRSRALVFAPPGQGVELAIRGINDLVLARTLVAAGDSRVVEFETVGSRIVSLERTAGGVPCVESVAFD